MIDNYKLYKHHILNAILNGAKSVINKENILNELNVFPVKDADTGSNLRSMMESIIKRSKVEASLKKTLETVSNAALLGSKGNSGLIFSQFLFGLSKNIDSDTIQINNLKDQFELGYLEAYQAIENPVEGTMITLMRELYKLLNEISHDDLDQNQVILVNQKLQLALEKTKEQLPVLKKNNVVDSGAYAFYTFIESFMLSITDESYNVKHELSSATLESSHDEEHYLGESIDFRYCTELLIETKLDKNSIKKEIQSYGDSLVIGKSSDYYKLHIHTNEPYQVMDALNRVSKIIDSKVDDMKNQYMLKFEKKMDVCILTDSIADINQNLIDQYQVQVLPIEIDIDGIKYQDKKTISNEMILNYMDDKKTPKSGSPSITSVKNQLISLLKVYKEIIIVTVSSKMSSTYQVIKNVVSDINNNHIHLIDSKQNSISQGLIVYEIAKKIMEKEPIEKLIDHANQLVDHSQILVHVSTLDYMLKSGRISGTTAKIANLVHLKPIISINHLGEGVIFKKAIGLHNSYKQILNHVKKVHKKYGIKSYAITYIDDLKSAEQFRSKLIEILGFLPEYMTQSSSVIAMSAGRNAVAVGYIKGV